MVMGGGHNSVEWKEAFKDNIMWEGSQYLIGGCHKKYDWGGRNKFHQETEGVYHFQATYV